LLASILVYFLGKALALPAGELFNIPGNRSVKNENFLSFRIRILPSQVPTQWSNHDGWVMYENSTLNILEKGHAWAAKHCVNAPFKMDSI